MAKNKNKITIGINASFLRKPQTGIGQVTLNFLRKLSNVETGRDLSLQIILYLEEDLPKELKLPRNFKKRIFLPIWKRDDLIRKIWWEKFSLPRAVKKDGCDIFLSLYQCPTVIARERSDRGNPVPIISRLLRFARNDNPIKHIMLVHDIVPKFFPEYQDNARKELYWKLTERGIKKAGKIIAISKRTEKDLIANLRIGADMITVNYIDADEIYKKIVAPEESARVLKKYRLKPGYIFAGGGYEIRKNVAGVIRAYKLLLEKNKNLRFLSEMPRLVIYGKVLPPSLSLALDVKRLLFELNLTKYVQILGETAQKDMPALFSNSKIFVYPSHYEGFGLPVLEAMNQGKPVIASKTSSLPEIGLDSVLYCHPNNTEDIAMVMKNLLLKEHLREDLSRRGFERAKNFSWDKFTDKVLNIIRNEIRE